MVQYISTPGQTAGSSISHQLVEKQVRNRVQYILTSGQIIGYMLVQCNSPTGQIIGVQACQVHLNIWSDYRWCRLVKYQSTRMVQYILNIWLEFRCVGCSNITQHLVRILVAGWFSITHHLVRLQELTTWFDCRCGDWYNLTQHLDRLLVAGWSSLTYHLVKIQVQFGLV